MYMLHLEILDAPHSKANSRRAALVDGSPRFIKSEKALLYEQSALWQLKDQLRGHETFLVPVAVQIEVYYPDRRQDLDVSLILDVLQKATVYKNDRLVEEMHLYRYIDKDNPRSIIAVWELEELF